MTSLTNQRGQRNFQTRGWRLDNRNRCASFNRLKAVRQRFFLARKSHGFDLRQLANCFEAFERKVVNSTESRVDYLDVLDRQIAFQRVFVEITGSVTAALFLSQALYWTQNKEVVARGGSFYKTYENWTEETGLTRHEIDAARKVLRDAGFLEEHYERLQHRMWYKLVRKTINEAIYKARSPKPDSGDGDNRKMAVGTPENRRSSISTETTSEITYREVSEKPPQEKKARKRDELFDTIATISGIDLTELNQVTASMIAKAKQQILQSSPKVTTDEIKRRAYAYRKKFTGAELTPTALAKHWATLGATQHQDTKQQILSYMP